MNIEKQLEVYAQYERTAAIEATNRAIAETDRGCALPMLMGLRVYRRRRYAEPQPPIRRITQHCPASGTAPMNLGLQRLSQACRKNDKKQGISGSDYA